MSGPAIATFVEGVLQDFSISYQADSNSGPAIKKVVQELVHRNQLIKEPKIE